MNKNWMDRLKNGENWKREGMNTLYVAIGLIGATAVDRLVQKGVEKFLPDMAPHIGYIKAGAQVLTGFGLSVLSDEKTPAGDRLRLIGYGVSSSGIISGLRMIPAVNDLMSEKTMSGLNGVEGLLGLALGDFGNAGNIKQYSTADAEQINLELPDLGRSESQFVYEAQEMQGVNISETEEVFAEII